MDYKEKYEEALSKAKEIYCRNYATDGGKLILEGMFPELKEIEGEIIRKGLIKGLSTMRDIYNHQTFSDDAININDAIAWLEKQDEQKLQDHFIDKACEWLEEHNDYLCSGTNGNCFFNIQGLLKDFRKAMEE